MFFGHFLLMPEANAEFIRLADQHVEVTGGKNVVPAKFLASSFGLCLSCGSRVLGWIMFDFEADM